jgi:heptosyltransferase III
MGVFCKSAPIRRLLIFRPGSLGDTVVALPSLHLIARAFPEAERWIITNRPVTPVSVPVKNLLDGSGLVDGYFEADYALVRSRFIVQWNLRKRIKQWQPDALVYIPGRRSLKDVCREWTFFSTCGIGRLIGTPFKASLRENLWEQETQRFEHEASRLARCLRSLGEARLDDPESWSLALDPVEVASARSSLVELGRRQLIICSIGTAVEVKDWGSVNWCQLFQALGQRARDYGLVMVGAASEHSLSELVRRHWPGSSVNLCGRLKIREIAAIMENAAVYLGHDSGPMHLAAAAGLPCVAIFASRELPGVWFPYGNNHKVIYHDVPCRRCQLDRCVKYAKRCIMSIRVDEVLEAAEAILRYKVDATDIKCSNARKHDQHFARQCLR